MMDNVLAKIIDEKRDEVRHLARITALPICIRRHKPHPSRADFVAALETARVLGMG
ncbi:MAG: hypothetical protein CM15mP46_1310 [Alphaproteobacteria bacterium]|nr:MAG: hypothetical protein CM15mP46_1310 [Alphaproteobacteria bacterium]